MNFDLFKARKREIMCPISINLNADSAAPKVSFEPSFMC